ncbi:hypothetical protein HHI36_013516 [Cryptolaemus montrouzieri]|uniref:Uncharacterized protein n=1 Tax=Cryptolaemus montrouzieri TaxID=559131 RepID=A0ABD2NHH0_9CUCU
MSVEEMENKDEVKRTQSESISKKDIDERLDFYSDKFDPVYALTVEKINLPMPTAMTHDNLSAYQSAQKPKPSASTAHPRKLEAERTKTEGENSGLETGKRRFLPHQSE